MLVTVIVYGTKDTITSLKETKFCKSCARGKQVCIRLKIHYVSTNYLSPIKKKPFSVHLTLVAFLVCTFTRFDIITSLIAYFMSFLCLSRGINYTICNDYLGFSRKIPMEFPPNFPIPCGCITPWNFRILKVKVVWLKLLIREKKEEYILYIFYIFYSLCKLVFTISIVVWMMDEVAVAVVFTNRFRNFARIVPAFLLEDVKSFGHFLT